MSSPVTSDLISRYVQPGKTNFAGRVVRYALRSWFQKRTKWADEYRAPNQEELDQIEAEFHELGMLCEHLVLDAAEFEAFVKRFPFPTDYHGGVDGGVYTEKLLEHFVAWKLLKLEHPSAGAYVDIAACASPWARLLRDAGVEAYAVDLDVDVAFRPLHYYRQEDATRSTFESSSISGASLQCAFEMFVGDHDHNLVVELARILTPGGRVVISPLYMHTHPCYYQTPEFFGTRAGDAGATAYIRRDAWGISASRKYSPQTLRTRIWETALECGLQPRLLKLQNKADFEPDIYLHFILVLDKPAGASL